MLQHSRRLIQLFLALVWLTSCDESTSPYPKLELRKEQIAVPARATGIAFTSGNAAFISLGRNNSISAFSSTDLWKYTPATNAVERKANFPGTARVGAIALHLNNVAYIGLGFDPSKKVYDYSARLDDFWKYDIATNTWTQLASFPKQKNGTTAAVVASVGFTYKHYIYVLTDFDTVNFSRELWRYHVNTNVWEQLKNFPGKNRTGAVSCTDGERYFFGTGYVVDQMNDWWEYFPENDTWLKRKSMPTKGRHNAVAFAVNNRFFVATGSYFGGNLTDGFLYDDIYEYDALKNTWYLRATLTDGGRENAIAFVLDDTAYIGFGENESGLVSDFYSFKP